MGPAWAQLDTGISETGKNCVEPVDVLVDVFAVVCSRFAIVDDRVVYVVGRVTRAAVLV